MKLFVGLGNPGAKYEKTRHNIGFLAVDAIARAHGFSPERAKFQAQLREGKLGTEKVFLLKPQTFMNLSGQSVGEAMRFYKLDVDDVIVFHDELDLAPGKMRLKTGGGHAGHNGLRSCHEHIGPEYRRVRLGIGHPGDKRLVSNYVLHDFAKADWDWIDRLMNGIGDAAALLASGDGSGFMNKVALVAKPPAAAKPAPKKGASETASTETVLPEPPEAGSPTTESLDNPVATSPFAKLTAIFGRK